MPTALQEAVSYGQIRDAIRAYLNPPNPVTNENTYRYWVRDVYVEGYAIAEDEMAKPNEVGRYIKVEYSVNDKGEVVVGAMTKVKVEYVPVTEALRLLEAKAKDPEGKVFDVSLIKKGWSKNAPPHDAYYSEPVLAAAAPLYEGAKAYADHPTETEMKDRPERSIRDLVGWYENVRVESGKLRAEFHLLESARPWLAPILIEKPDLVGLSHNAMGKTKLSEAEGRTGRVVEAIAKVNSVDVVTTPAAGGSVDKLIASARPDTINPTAPEEGTETMELKDLTLEALRQQRPDLVQRLEEAARQAAKTEADTAAQSLRESVQRSDARAANAEAAVAKITAKATLVERLSESNLPAPAKMRVKALLEAAQTPMKDGALDDEAWSTRIKEAVQAEQDYLTKLGEGAVKGAGATDTTSTLAEAVKNADAALDKAFGVVPAKEGN
jgi:hypothetical protein